MLPLFRTRNSKGGFVRLDSSRKEEAQGKGLGKSDVELPPSSSQVRQEMVEDGGPKREVGTGQDLPGNEALVRRLDPDRQQERHYILVIHGTFDAPPKTGPTPWYWKGDDMDNFCFRLATDVGDTYMGFDSMWRSLPESHGLKGLSKDIPYPFHWDGMNTHDGRVQAGRRLAKLINYIGKNDPAARIHIIAHSHGGNVLLKAVSKYLSILRKECGQEYNAQISKDFWDAYRGPYESIAAHQKAHGVPWYVHLLAPFAILRRPWAQEEDLGPFLWGYWEFTDRLLGLPQYRQRKYLRKKWAASSNTNALGHLIFLGTPFYSKYWQANASVYLALSIFVYSAIMFLTILGVAALFFYLDKDVNNNITSLKIAFWLITPFACLAFVTFSTLTGKRYKEGNLYHVESRAWSPAMRALVLNAGKLDEAALALSTEPLVRAYLFPQIKALLTPDPWRGLRPFPAKGIVASAQNLYNNVGLTLWNVIFAIPYLLLATLNFVLVPIFCDAVLRLFTNLGFGLQKGELDAARVYVEEHLRLDPSSHTIEHWGVQKILTAAANEALPQLTRESEATRRSVFDIDDNLER